MCVVRATLQLINIPCDALVQVANLPLELGEAELKCLHAAQHVALAVLYDVD